MIANRFESNKTLDLHIVADAYNNLVIGNSFVSINKISDAGVNTIIRDNYGYKTENSVLSDIFGVDSVGIKIVTMAHGLDMIPKLQDCCVTVVQNTVVDDWRYDMLKIVNTTITSVIAKINISTASKLVRATARLGLKIGNS